ncbi:MAG: pyridoxamine 5'-phosphate oxidase family protein [Clostridia bacterium]|nr:pyridoxamine 5'-phosphate oxidase family protein [Clostridia bacterium]
MFRPIRRKDRAMPREECMKVLRDASTGVLALSGDDGYPYALPINYVFHDDKLFFHSAAEGHKIDAVRRCDKASFCVTDRDRVCPEGYTTHYRSVIVFGRIRLLENEAEKHRALLLLADKYCAGMGQESHERIISAEMPAVAVLEMLMEHIAGKKHPEVKA